MGTATYEEFVGNPISRLLRDADPAALTAMLLRTNSAEGHTLLAQGATGGKLDYEHLSEIARTATARPGWVNARDDVTSALEPDWLRGLARFVALRRTGADQEVALALLELVRGVHGIETFNEAAAALYAQLLVGLGRLRRLRETMPLVDVADEFRWSVELDALNPYKGRGPASLWLDKLNTIFTGGGLEPVSLSPSTGAAFDRLTSKAGSSADGPEMVTVIMSAYRPNQSIFTAVRSILTQSWRNLELLVVDDASPERYRGVLKQVAEMDERIRVLTCRVNGGTYLARNLALGRARGEFVTFQDCDDWAHPRRIERQIAPLLADPELLATRSRSLRAFPDLTFTFVGYPPGRIYQPSLLFRRKPVIDLIGFFDTVRKSGDVEFANRLKAAAPGSVLEMAEPRAMTIYQLRQDSLSRGDAIPGWWDWTRRAYWDAFCLWHEQIRCGMAKPRLDGQVGARAIPLPDHSWGPRRASPAATRTYDVLLLNDWRAERARSAPLMIEEIRIMLDQGMRVAVVHSETPYPLAQRRQRLRAPIQSLINSGDIDLIHLTQDVRVEKVIVCDPATLQFPSNLTPSVITERVAILAYFPGHGSDYRVTDCLANAERMFSCRPVWTPRDAQARVYLTGQLHNGAVTEFDLPVAFDPSRWAVPTRGRRSDRPVLGRHMPDYWSHWPATRSELLRAYPNDDRFDVRILGGHRVPLRVLGQRAIPPNWVSFKHGGLDVRTFLAQIDFFVYFPHPRGAVRMQNKVLEAMASGCIVILPSHFEATYRDGAVYCDPQSVRDVVLYLHDSPADYAGQVQRGRAYLEQTHESPEAFREKLGRLGSG